MGSGGWGVRWGGDGLSHVEWKRLFLSRKRTLICDSPTGHALIIGEGFFRWQNDYIVPNACNAIIAPAVGRGVAFAIYVLLLLCLTPRYPPLTYWRCAGTWNYVFSAAVPWMAQRAVRAAKGKLGAWTSVLSERESQVAGLTNTLSKQWRLQLPSDRGVSCSIRALSRRLLPRRWITLSATWLLGRGKRARGWCEWMAGRNLVQQA